MYNVESTEKKLWLKHFVKCVKYCSVGDVKCFDDEGCCKRSMWSKDVETKRQMKYKMRNIFKDFEFETRLSIALVLFKQLTIKG